MCEVKESILIYNCQLALDQVYQCVKTPGITEEGKGYMNKLNCWGGGGGKVRWREGRREERERES